MSQGDNGAPGLDEAGLLPAGTTLGEYQLVRAVGAGGMAVVYEARHKALNKRVAIKVLQSGHGGLKPDMAKRFLREAESAAKLSHAHVVDVANVGVANGIPFMVMEFLEGEDLGTYLERHKKLSVESTADLLLPVVCGLEVAHAAGIVHRDLKPQNIFLCKPRGVGEIVPKVVDFGISKSLDGQSMQLTGTDAILGTPFYMSPEQAMEAKNVDARTDQFSLGVILYECVTGQRPFAGDSLFTVLTAIVNLNHERPSSITYPMDPAFEALVNRALAKKPGERFESMAALGRALLPFASLRVQMAFAVELNVTLPENVRREAERMSEIPITTVARKREQKILQRQERTRMRTYLVGASLALLLALLIWWKLSAPSEDVDAASVPPLPAEPAKQRESQGKAQDEQGSDWAGSDTIAGDASIVVEGTFPGAELRNDAPVVQVDTPVAPTRVEARGSTREPSVAPRGAGNVEGSKLRTGPSNSASGSQSGEGPRPERGANRALIIQ